MNSLIYLMLRQAKNRLLELKTKPAKLVVYILAIGFMVYLVVQAMGIDIYNDYAPPSDGGMFTAILAGFFMFTFVATLYPAFSKGASLFEMEDVNYLFVSPIRPRTILLYGMIKSVKTIILGSWFIVFQANWMRGFGVSMGGVFLAGLGYILVAIVSQILSLFIYANTNSRPRRKLWSKVILTVLFVPAVAVFAMQFVQGASLTGALSAMLASPAFVVAPVVGVASAGIGAVLFGELVIGLVYIGLLAAAGMFFFFMIYFGNPDYYEDVMGATETAFEISRAAKEGDTSVIASTNREVKIKGTGVSGSGASVFFYKHVRESFRCNRFGLWGIGSLIMVGAAIAWAIFTRSGEIASALEMMLIPLLTGTILYKMFTAGMCRGIMETYSHYIYMVPDKPFVKWFWANVETVFKAVVEGVVVFVAVWLILGTPVLATFAAMLAFIMFTFYLSGINLASMRIVDTHLATSLLLIIYFSVVLIPLLPGLAAAIAVGVLVSGPIGIALAFLAFSAWMMLVGVGCFALSKGLLHKCDMPVMREGM
ncbi:MAG: putative ABC exporter domain-containing protein [Defluviitaleaceae bacterium]|nr:putative ABC exporter domain-containing protein [Defluviitaleaceae bacterium]